MKIRPEKNSDSYDTSQRSTNFPTSQLREFICNQHNNKLSVGLVAQLVERCTGNVEVMDSNSVRVWIFSGLIFPSTSAVFVTARIASIFVFLFVFFFCIFLRFLSSFLHSFATFFPKLLQVFLCIYLDKVSGSFLD